MELFLSKLFPELLYPLGLVCIFITLALVLSRRKRLQRALLAMSLGMLWLGGNPWVAQALARSLEYRYLPPSPVPHAPVLVLLGGGTYPASYPRPMVEVNGAGDRVLYAAWLYQQGVTPVILLSGGVLDWSGRPSTPPQEMAALLTMMGVPQEALWFEERSRNTYESAVNCARLLRQKGISRILLVTSAWHMPRALALFRKQGLEVVPLPVDYSVSDAPQGFEVRRVILGLVPSADSLALTVKIMKEYLGMWMYRMRGWI